MLEYFSNCEFDEKNNDKIVLEEYSMNALL